MKIKDQFAAGNNTVLLFDNLKMANTKFVADVTYKYLVKFLVNDEIVSTS